MQKALSVDEAATFTGLSKNYIYKLVCQKKIPYYKPMNGRVFFRQEELEAFIFQNRQGPTFEGTSHG
jgi:excisionase family DNA binding protein